MILRAAVLWTLLALPVFATVEGWPALYDVTGVAPDDVLNVRAAPRASAEIVGALPADGTAIEVIEITRNETWGLVNAGEVSGWASMAFLARRPGQWAGAAPELAHCVGTEPFWSLSIDGEQATFETPDALPLRFLRSSKLRSRNRIDRHAAVYENDLGGLVATLRNTSCNDGMSDRAFGWEVDLLLVVAGEDNAQLFSGCCSLRSD